MASCLITMCTMDAAQLKTYFKFVPVWKFNCPLKMLSFCRRSAIMLMGDFLDGWRHNPQKYFNLWKTSHHTKGAYIQKVFCALNCVFLGLPSYAQMASSLQNILERVYENAQQRTHRGERWIQPRIFGWETGQIGITETVFKPSHI